MPHFEHLNLNNAEHDPSDQTPNALEQLAGEVMEQPVGTHETPDLELEKPEFGGPYGAPEVTDPTATDAFEERLEKAGPQVSPDVSTDPELMAEKARLAQERGEEGGLKQAA